MAALLAVGVGSYCQETGETGMSAFGRLVPLGYVNRQVRIPSFADDGKIATTLTAETLIRIDDDRLQAGKCTIEIAGKRREEDIRVDLMSAIYYMSDRTLRSGDRSQVSRSDFRVEGDSMVFDTQSSIGRMKGHVRTIIFDTDALSGKSGGVPQPAN
ncbi:MAG: hypothetical protein U0984_12405 [Prosthecobacter sp.]|nr:hypothetical protein [Prosthecobacter sp.]